MPVARRPRLLPWQQNMWATVAAEVLALLAFGASNILVPYYLQELGISDMRAVGAWTGAYQSAGSIAFAIFTPIWGAVGDRYGRRLMLIRAMAATALVLVGMGFARTPIQLLLLRIVQGAVTGTPSAASALLAAGSPRDRLAFALGLLQTSVFVGSSLGPMVGGYVGDAYGYRATFFATAVLVVVALGVVLALVREPERSAAALQQARRERPLRVFADLLKSRYLLVLIGISLLVSLAGSLTAPVLPLFIQELATDRQRLASIAGTVTGASALSAALAALVAGHLSDRIGHRRVMLACSAGIALLFFPQALAPSALALGVALTVQGLFRGGISPSLSALVANHSPADKIGSALGLCSSANSIGYALGPLLGAAALAVTGTRAVFAIDGVAFALVTVVLLVTGRVWDRQAPAQPSA